MKIEWDLSKAHLLVFAWVGLVLLLVGMGLMYPMARWALLSFNTYCDDQTCGLIVQQIRRSVDTRAHPCDDFYNFTCGRWNGTNPFYVDQRERRQAKFWEGLEASMLRLDTTKHSQGAVEKAARLYTSCKRMPFNDHCNLKPVMDMLADLNLTWPFGTKRVIPGGGVISGISVLTQAQLNHGIDLLYEGGVRLASAKPRKLSFMIGNLLHAGPFVKNEIILKKVITRLATMMGGPDDYAAMATLVIEQEKTFQALGHGKASEERSYTTETYKEAAKTFPDYRWSEVVDMINAAFNPRTPLTTDDTVIISAPSVTAATTLEKGTQSALHAFLGWRLVRQLAPMGCSRFGFVISRNGNASVDEVSNALASTAFGNLQRFMPTAVVAPYVLEDHLSELKEIAKALKSRLMKGIEEFVRSSKHLTKEFKKTAIKLLRHTKAHFLYPDYDHIDAQVDSQYRYMPDFDGDCLQMSLTLMRSGRRHEYGTMQDASLQGDDWLRWPLDIDVAYNVELDSLFVPLGAITPPLFASGAPLAWNIGALGVHLAREMFGQLFGLASSANQLQNISCFRNDTLVDTYALLLAEDSLRLAIIDEGHHIERQGFRTLYLLRSHRLLYFASCFELCGGDPAVNKPRCNAPLENSEEFSYVFQCPEGALMNPTKKCDV